MNNSTENRPKKLSELLSEASFNRMARAFEQYGYDSPQFKQAEYDYQTLPLKAEADYQIKKALSFQADKGE